MRDAIEHPFDSTVARAPRFKRLKFNKIVQVATELDTVSDQEARIARAIESLRADFDRQGYVTDDQVVRAVHKRKIEARGTSTFGRRWPMLA